VLGAFLTRFKVMPLAVYGRTAEGHTIMVREVF
jgi:hypothetical protein